MPRAAVGGHAYGHGGKRERPAVFSRWSAAQAAMANTRLASIQAKGETGPGTWLPPPSAPVAEVEEFSAKARPSFLCLTPPLVCHEDGLQREGPWPFDSEGEWREFLRDYYGVTIQEDGSMLMSPYGQSLCRTYLIGTLLPILLLPDDPGYMLSSSS